MKEVTPKASLRRICRALDVTRSILYDGDGVTELEGARSLSTNTLPTLSRRAIWRATNPCFPASRR